MYPNRDEPSNGLSYPSPSSSFETLIGQLTEQKQTFLFGFQTIIQNQTIGQLDRLGPFKYQTYPVFRWLLNWTKQQTEYIKKSNLLPNKTSQLIGILFRFTDLSILATILLGELLHSASVILPRELNATSHCLPALLAEIAGSDPNRLIIPILILLS